MDSLPDGPGFFTVFVLVLKEIIIEIFRVYLAVYFMLNTCILRVFKQMYYEKQIAKLNKFTKLHISELF